MTSHKMLSRLWPIHDVHASDEQRLHTSLVMVLRCDWLPLWWHKKCACAPTLVLNFCSSVTSLVLPGRRHSSSRSSMIPAGLRASTSSQITLLLKYDTDSHWNVAQSTWRHNVWRSLMWAFKENEQVHLCVTLLYDVHIAPFRSVCLSCGTPRTCMPSLRYFTHLYAFTEVLHAPVCLHWGTLPAPTWASAEWTVVVASRCSS